MQDPNGQKLTYDYTKLDEYLKFIDPETLDQYFRALHSQFTKTLIIAFNLDSSSSGEAIDDDARYVGRLDEFFQILGNLEKGGKS